MTCEEPSKKESLIWNLANQFNEKVMTCWIQVFQPPARRQASAGPVTRTHTRPTAARARASAPSAVNPRFEKMLHYPRQRRPALLRRLSAAPSGVNLAFAFLIHEIM